MSAFAFAPNAGSEGGVGWHWATELAKNHQVTVITDVTRRVGVKSAGVSVPENLRIVYFRPRWLRALPLNSATAQLLYAAWQFGLLPFARRLHRNEHFDLAMHLTYSVFRHPSFLGFLGIPFIFGPLGGGEDVPLALKRSIHGMEKFREIARTFVNKAALLDPFLWLAYARANLILVSTKDTGRALPWPFRKRAIVYPNLGVDGASITSPKAIENSGPLRVLFAGRLLGWKGVHLAIRALAEAHKAGISATLDIAGSGPYESELRALAACCGVEPVVHWHGGLARAELFHLYDSMHCLLFPSLHDSGGTVVLEAQARGLPVICLDVGGPATLVAPGSAIAIPVEHCDEDIIVQRLADALTALATDRQKLAAMNLAALSHARSISWEARANGALALLASQEATAAK